jgi:hypothetical protein
MAKVGAQQLENMISGRRLVQFRRRFEESLIHGYVLDVGPEFFLLALVSDRIWFDGFECFRIGDIYDLAPDRRVAFVEAALEKRGERLQDELPISLASVESLLATASQAFPLVAIHREEVDPDVCHIGRVVGIARGQVSLLEINPDATWDEQPISYRLREITRVNFGGDYENALHLVGGIQEQELG